MIFSPTRTRRISVRLQELALGQAIDLCELPAERHELTATELLRYSAVKADAPLPRYVTEPALWTVEERTLLVCHYLSHVASDGPDFAVGGGKLSDYVMFDRDLTQDSTDLGEVAGHRRVMMPLLGIHAQTLETRCKSRGDWIIGAIACQIRREDDAEVDLLAMSEVERLTWVDSRMSAIRQLPESDFESVFAAYWTGVESLTHFFNIDFDDQGLVYQPVEKEGSGALGPARFLADSCISDTARSLSRGPAKPGR